MKRMRLDRKLTIRTFLFSLLLLLASSFSVINAASDNTSVISPTTFFIDQLVEQYGSNGTLSVDELRDLLSNLTQGKNTGHEIFNGGRGSPGQATPTSEPPRSARPTEQGTSSSQTASYHYSSVCGEDSWKNNPSCWTRKCLSVDDILLIHSIPGESGLNGSQLHQISPSLLFTAQNRECNSEENEVIPKPNAAQVWGYGLLCVTVINLCSLGGLAFLPLMSKKFYRKLLMFMVALAVGTLCGSALLFLIPSCFDMTADNSPHLHTYIWKCMTIIGGIYLFFLVERLLKIILEWRQAKHEEHLENMPHFGSVRTQEVHRDEGMNMSFEVARSVTQQASANTVIERDNSSAQLLADTSANDLLKNGNPAKLQNGQPNGTYRSDGQSEAHRVPEVNFRTNGDEDNEEDAKSVIGSGIDIPPRKRIKTVAWMVIFGDGLHNFIDGLSIGAAFAQSILSGVSISIAVVCEELPHELGDFAILLNSGMSMKQAMSCNFLSACMCYLGFMVGALIGDTTEHALWIFAVAGGMFLYISLVDMLPEVNQAAEEETKKTGRPWHVFLLQNAGLLSGFGIMLLLAKFGEMIEFS